MLAYLDANNNPQPWDPSIPIDGTYHSADIEQSWTAAELTAIGLYPVVLFMPPAGEMITPGSSPTYTLNGPEGDPTTTVIQTYPTQPILPVKLPPQAANDTAAAAAGVAVGGTYCNGSQMMMRQS
jgi:hypothetical protein